MISQKGFKWTLKIRYYKIHCKTKRRISSRIKKEYQYDTRDACFKKIEQFNTCKRELFSYTILDHFNGLFAYFEIE